MRILSVSLSLTIWILLSLCSSVRADIGQFRILVLLSYDPELSWSHELVAGIKAGLAGTGQKHDLYFEYMDSKRFNSSEYYRSLSELYSHKYLNYSPDLIITADNNALEFVRTYAGNLFASKPIVFCGVNGFNSKMIDGLEQVTGVAEAISFRETIELAYSLHPDLTEFVVFASQTPTYSLNREVLKRALEKSWFSGKVRFVEEATIKEIQRQAAALNPKAVILLNSALMGDDGVILSFEKSARLLTEASAVPVYSFWEFYVRYGAVGGKVVSGYSQGRQAALMAARIMAGETASDIPVLLESPNPYVFNYHQLRRFEISELSLPGNSEILNRPASFLEQYPGLIWAGGSGVVLLVFIILLLFVDSIRRRSLAARLRTARDFLQTVIDGVAEPIMVIGPDYRIIDSNQAARDDILQGADHDRTTCHQVTYNLDTPCDRHGMSCSLQKVRETGEPMRVIQQFSIRVGKPILYDVLVSPIYSDDGSFAGLVKSMRDVTSLIQTRSELTTEKNRLAVTLNSIGDGVIATDETGVITLLNPVAETMTGWKQVDAVGRMTAEVLPLVDVDSREPIPDTISAVIETGNHVGLNDNVLLITRNGDECVISDSADPIRAEDGSLMGAVLVFRDVTAEKRVEQELVRAQQLESLGLLAGGIAHDFNNLLMGIRANIELVLANPAVPDDARVFLRQGESACERAGDLTIQLLTFAKGGTPTKELFNIDKVLDEWVSFSLRGSLNNYILEMDEELMPIYADQGQLRQLVSNLVINANQAMLDGGEITVRAGHVWFADALAGTPLKNGKYLRIDVEDQGPGIPQDDLLRIFTPYYTTKEKGSGLGLAIAYSIAKRHDGHLTVSNHLERGAIFSFYLPITGAVSAVVKAEKAKADTDPFNLNLLLMDDEDIVCTVVAEMLRQFGHSVTTVRDGREAIDLFQEKHGGADRFTGVILDLTVPGGMGGVETLVGLKNIDPHVKAIASSGYADDPIMAEPQSHGFAGAISKPFSLEELRNSLRAF